MVNSSSVAHATRLRIMVKIKEKSIQIEVENIVRKDILPTGQFQIILVQEL